MDIRIFGMADGTHFGARTAMTSNPQQVRSSRVRTIAYLVAVFALAFSVASPQHAAAATISVATERQGDAIEIQASALLKADTATAWRKLTDYDRYTEFIPDLRVSRVRACHGTSVIVEQSGEAALWVLRMPLDITFDITEFPPNALESRAVAGSLRLLESRTC